MRTNLTKQIREALRNAPDGFTIQQIADAICSTYDPIRRRIVLMPDAYIDRWVYKSPKSKLPTAVWSVVVPPPNCPKPGKSK